MLNVKMFKTLDVNLYVKAMELFMKKIFGVRFTNFEAGGQL